MEADRIARLLPETYRAAVAPGTPLGALLDAMAALQAPVETMLGRRETYVDPNRAPDPFVLMLADWLDLAAYLDWSGGRPGAGVPRYAPGLGHLRALAAEAAELTRWRGTGRALLRFLTLATGVEGYAVTENPPGPGGTPRPFHLVVQAPAAAARYRNLVERIVDRERPVYATYEIVFAAP